MAIKNIEDERIYKRERAKIYWAIPENQNRRRENARRRRTEHPETRQKYQKENRELINKKQRIWRKENKEICNIKQRENYAKNKEYRVAYSRDWYYKNIEKEQKRCREWYQSNIEKGRAMSARYRKNNIEKIKEKTHTPEYRVKYNKWERERKKTNLKYNLNKKIGLAIRQSLKNGKNGRHWESLVEYTLNDLIKRLKKTMPAGYAWEDVLSSKLHIDHKIPIDAFNYSKPEHIDFQRCWALKNLQLLPARENMIKHNKLYRPFQPALAF